MNIYDMCTDLIIYTHNHRLPPLSHAQLLPARVKFHFTDVFSSLLNGIRYLNIITKNEMLFCNKSELRNN